MRGQNRRVTILSPPQLKGERGTVVRRSGLPLGLVVVKLDSQQVKAFAERELEYEREGGGAYVEENGSNGEGQEQTLKGTGNA